MSFSVKLLQNLDKLEPDLKSVLFELLAEIEQTQQERVTKKEFSEFAQKTDENFQKVWKAIGELAEAQKQTEQRVGTLAQAQEALAEAQKRTEQRLEILAEAQKRTEQRLEILAEAQERTEQRLEVLALAQERLTEQMQKLTQKVTDLSSQVGGISHTVGYGLEDRSYPILKKIIKRDFGVAVERLFRKNIVYSRNHFDEINIYGEGTRDGEQIYVIGECKAQFGPNDVNRYVTLLERVREHLEGQIIPLALAYHYHPQAEERLKNQDIKYYWSYELSEESSP